MAAFSGYTTRRRRFFGYAAAAALTMRGAARRQRCSFCVAARAQPFGERVAVPWPFGKMTTAALRARYIALHARRRFSRWAD